MDTSIHSNSNGIHMDKKSRGYVCYATLDIMNVDTETKEEGCNVQVNVRCKERERERERKERNERKRERSWE